MPRRDGNITAHAAVDLGAGLAASAAVSPFILIIDRAIIEAAAGTRTLAAGVWRGCRDAVARPRAALLANPAYYMVAGTYAVTYAAANWIDTYAAVRGTPAAAHATAQLLGTTAVNTSACIAKDVAFARMFGAPGGSTRKMPLATVGLFGARDLITIASAFTMPPLLAAALGGGPSAEYAAQMVSPVAMQAVCAPCHLLALNYYNAPVATLAERARAVFKLAPATTVAYGVRMAPAFGIGGVMNKALVARGHAAVGR
mmetsp:Transcript_25354/g.76153  ORF Transcript_25354/g.76153 Transcript_25354/m.76153 type:complete len:257 (-) Transcript_25354:161-931(-)|eukprot:CAMPEP_0119295084 /NCGR_PEP_ID=MMETSP1329-20130426/49199_1 /TAXON_ID=114041 /ORGANISM="Genus nov. species nov., Strain RCC1024" /LENGTH=256 /DNA_ID=CAMNT_0007295995 /DNA_START=77 /DNA_END=847 /DNA_ORIENTATION=-